MLEIFSTAKDSGKRLDALLHERFPEWSRSRIQGWIKDGRVRVNDAVEKPSFTIRGTEKVEVEPAALPALHASPEPIPLEILYEDEWMVAVDKPAGMVVHAGAGVSSGTVVNALLHRFAQLSSVGDEARPGIVHRLDRHTSGVLLVAKTDAMHHALAHLFASRNIRKNYLALVHGSITLDRGRIEKPIARDPYHRTRMTARLSSGRSAWTEWRILERFPRFTYLDVLIGTGRTHQIRVHLSNIGHPVVGDPLYGAPAHVSGLPALTRFFLHAHQIAFTHPLTAKPLQITAPVPEELAGYLAQVRSLSGDKA